MDKPEYLHLKPGDEPPSLLENVPYKAVVVIEAEVTPEWQNRISDWLVRSGCRFMMAWGKDSTTWDESVDWANLEMFDYKDFPEEDLVLTTWHDKEPLEEAFYFCQACAFHPSVEIHKIYIVHIAHEPRANEILRTFDEAKTWVY